MASYWCDVTIHDSNRVKYKKKFSSIIYSDTFLVEWNNIICSVDLMRIINTHKENLLLTINSAIESIRELYSMLDEDLTKFLDKLEQDIMNTKRQKYLRDVQGYQ